MPKLGKKEQDPIDQYFSLKQLIYDFFGYEPGWVEIPLEDSREYYWTLDEDESGGGSVCFGETAEDIDTYENDIYTQRFLDKFVYRKDKYTMICVDTGCDGNKFLQIFDNEKEIKENE